LSIELAVIGGTGVYKLAALEDEQALEGGTIYGEPSGPVRVGKLGGHAVAFLARHGEGHSRPPHLVNYRANLQRLKDIGARRVLAINAVGGITARMGPRVVAVPEQLIDYTWGRVSTICEEPGTPVLHVDFGDPFTGSLRQALLAAGRRASVALVDGGCLGVTQGPRLETKAEVARLRRDGCDLFGMSTMPEASLARELGLEFAALEVVANWAAGCGAEGEGPAAEITFAEVLENVEAASANLPRLLAALLEGPAKGSLSTPNGFCIIGRRT
jgi:5'-methylthioinosine phosphorylase